LQHIERRAPFRIAHQRKVDQSFDRTFAEPLPQRVVFGLEVGLCGMGQPVDADLPKIFEARFHAEVEAVQRREKCEASAGCGGPIDDVGGQVP